VPRPLAMISTTLLAAAASTVLPHLLPVPALPPAPLAGVPGLTPVAGTPGPAPGTAPLPATGTAPSPPGAAATGTNVAAAPSPSPGLTVDGNPGNSPIVRLDGSGPVTFTSDNAEACIRSAPAGGTRFVLKCSGRSA
jgi:hypothetical protein